MALSDPVKTKPRPSSRPLFHATLDVFLREGARFIAIHEPGDDVVVLCIGARDAITVFTTPSYAAALAAAVNMAAQE